MNKRLRELRQQATLVETYTANDGTVAEGRHVDLEKFAELIVRECMQLNRDILCEDDPDYLDQVYKEHFGVEE